MSGPAPLPSLRAELLRLTTLVALGWLLVLALTVSWAVRHEVNDLLDEALREAAEVMYGVLATAPQGAQAPMALPEVLPAPAHDEKFVWQIVDMKSVKTRVRVVQRNPDAILVSAELKQGDRVATEGLQRVREGGAVRITGEKPPEVASR